MDFLLPPTAGSQGALDASIFNAVSPPPALPGLFEMLFQIGIGESEPELGDQAELESAGHSGDNSEPKHERSSGPAAPSLLTMPVAVAPWLPGLDPAPVVPPVQRFEYLQGLATPDRSASPAIGKSLGRATDDRGPTVLNALDAPANLPAGPLFSGTIAEEALPLTADLQWDGGPPTRRDPARTAAPKRPAAGLVPGIAPIASVPGHAFRAAATVAPEGNAPNAREADAPAVGVVGVADVRVMAPPKEGPQPHEPVSFVLVQRETIDPIENPRPALAPGPEPSRVSSIAPAAASIPAVQALSGVDHRSDSEGGFSRRGNRDEDPASLPGQPVSTGSPANFTVAVEPPLVEIAQPPLKQSAPPVPADDSLPLAPQPRPISALSLQVEDQTGTRVDLHVRSTPERIEMAVATPDASLSDDLRRRLPELAAAVERQGYDLRPNDVRPGAAWADGESPGQRSQQRQQHNRPKQRRPVSTPAFTLGGAEE